MARAARPLCPLPPASGRRFRSARSAAPADEKAAEALDQAANAEKSPRDIGRDERHVAEPDTWLGCSAAASMGWPTKCERCAVSHSSRHCHYYLIGSPG